MIRSLLKLAALLIAGILVYNYFFGTNEEKENSRRVFGQIKGVVVSVGQLVGSEKDKFDAGKYDAALDKLGGVYKAIRTQAGKLDDKVIQRLDGLENRKSELQTELRDIEREEAQTAMPSKKKDPKAEQAKTEKAAEQVRRKAQLLRELESLIHDSENLLDEAGK